MDVGYQVHLANPSAIKKYEGLKYSGNFADAAYFAHLLRCRTAQILSIEGVLIQETGGRMRSETDLSAHS